MMATDCWSGWCSFAIQLTIALGTNLVAGLYSGMIVARVMQFRALRSEALRLVRAIDFVPGDPTMDRRTIDAVRRTNVQFTLISSELYSMGYEQAGDAINRVSRDFDRILGSQRIEE